MARQGYGKLSNDFHSNTKVKKLRRICPSAIGVYAVAISYCSDELNDGVMSEDDVLYQLDATDDEVEALLKVGLFERDDDGSYRIHDYLVHQSSREQVESKAEGRATASASSVPEPKSRPSHARTTRMSQACHAVTVRMSHQSHAVTPLTKNQEPRTKRIFLTKNPSPKPPRKPRGPTRTRSLGRNPRPGRTSRPCRGRSATSRPSGSWTGSASSTRPTGSGDAATRRRS